MSFKSHQNRKRFGQFKAKIRSLTSRNIIQLQWHQSGKFFRLRAVIKVRSQEKNKQLVITVINNGKINLVCNTNLLQTLYKTFIDKDWQCLEVGEKASHFLEWCPIWVTSQRVSLLLLIEGGIYGRWKPDSCNLRSPCFHENLALSSGILLL